MTHIMIDGYNLGLEKGTGVATYSRNLSYALRELGHEVSVLYGKRASASRDPLMREISFFDAEDSEKKKLSIGEALDLGVHAVRGQLGYSAVDIPMTGQVITRSFGARLPDFDHILNVSDLYRRTQGTFSVWGKMIDVAVPTKPDLMHWTYPLPLRISKRPNIYTLHDLVPLRLPYTTLDNKKRYYKLLRKLEKTADHFVTVSECSKRDIVDMLGISPDRVTNTYQAVDIPAALRNRPEEQVMREVEGLAGVGYKNYFLFWGSIEPKKNIGRMIEAYLACNTQTPLVIVGAMAWKSTRELALLNSGTSGVGRELDQGNVPRKGIVRLSYVPFNLLVSLIRGAKAALFPSLYEGFGLPALEAMQLGTPVLCSNTASLPEVVGDAALTVDPYDVAALTAAIGQLDADAGLRAELVRRGLVRAAMFSQSAYRERLENLYGRFL